MEHSSCGLKVLLFVTFSLHLSSAGTHSMQYLYTAVTPGINIPEFTFIHLVDGELSEYYDSNIKKIIPKTEWIKKIDADDPHYWYRESQEFVTEAGWLKDDVATAMKLFNQTKGVHTVQLMYGCELNDDGTTRAYKRFGYDGEDFIFLDLKAKAWNPAANAQSVITENAWSPAWHDAEDCAFYLKYECIDLLKKFVSYGRETLERKDRPEVSVFQKHSSSPEVVCHATGFFPKAVAISWQKDGEDVYEDVELRETLPNQDGSFQKRSILKVPAEELQKHTYTCVIQHSSLEDKMVKEVPKDGAPIAVIVAVVAALIALVAVVAGIVVWKKKNSGFKRLPPKPSSEGDSSSNNSSSETVCLPAELREVNS